jgi:hypothetical protein
MDTTTNPVFIQIGDEIIELKGTELELFNAERDALATEEAARIAAEEAKAAEKAALLARLGITADEAKLLLG